MRKALRSIRYSWSRKQESTKARKHEHTNTRKHEKRGHEGTKAPRVSGSTRPLRSLEKNQCAAVALRPSSRKNCRRRLATMTSSPSLSELGTSVGLVNA